MVKRYNWLKVSLKKTTNIRRRVRFVKFWTKKRPRCFHRGLQFLEVASDLVLCFFFFYFFASFLIDNFHRQTDFAAVIKAQQLDLDLLAFLQNV